MKHNGSFRSSLGAFRSLPVGIWALGFVSMFMDISSELIHSLLPVFMVSVLGVSMTTIGLIEGVAEATAAISKIVSGVFSDYLGRRKSLAVIGYGLAALTKPVFPMANTIGWVFAARFMDRIGKGIRGAPRDALVADIAPRELRGAAYGLRQSLDSVGALVGPLIALLCMGWYSNNIRAVLWVAVVPGLIAVALLVVGVREIQPSAKTPGVQKPLKFEDIRRLPQAYWLVVLLGGTFTMARFSEAFLVLRAQDVGVALGYIPMVLVAMNFFYTASAYPAGVAADRISRRTLLLAGTAVLVAADLVLALASTPLPAFIGASLWGVHMGLTQGLFAKLVADTSPTDLRGSAFGIFNLVIGVALLVSSLIAGGLWSFFGAGATFVSGALFASLTMLGLCLFWQKPRPPIE